MQPRRVFGLRIPPENMAARPLEPQTPDNSGPTRTISLLLRLLPLVALAAAGVTVWWLGLTDALSLYTVAIHGQELRAWVEAHTLLALTLYMLLYAAVVALSLPAAAALTVTGGFLFGWLAGGTATVIAATAGAVAVFLLARGALAAPFARLSAGRIETLRAGFQEDAISYLLFLRLVPAFPFWLVNLAPALLGVRLRDFVIATAIGIIPGTFAFALAGAGLDSVLAAQAHAWWECMEENPAPGACSARIDPYSLLTPELLAALAALGAVALLPAIVKKLWRRQRGGR
jgi:uncharacterized membrane protein YdjX (TVP38/TMEM64 family)